MKPTLTAFVHPSEGASNKTCESSKSFHWWKYRPSKSSFRVKPKALEAHKTVHFPEVQKTRLLINSPICGVRFTNIFNLALA